MDNFLSNKKILVIVAHPDDEVLGIGGTVHNLVVNHSCKIEALILGEGITSRAKNRFVELWNDELKKHKQNIRDAQLKIGYNNVKTYDFPDNRFDSVDLLDLIKVVEEEKNRFEPNIIMTHHGGDLNIDHQRTFEATITATRPMKDEVTDTIITFETPSGTEWRASSDPKHFIPNFYYSLTAEDIKAKIQAIECYEFEKRKFPHPRSPEALEVLARQRGIIIGAKYAEAFTIVRHVINNS